MTAPAELWKPCPGFDAHEVSSQGRIRRSRNHRILCGQVDAHGYLQVRLSTHGKQATRRIHRLIALAFIGPRPRLLQCHHLNGNKTDNRARNMGYVTCKENLRHASETGLLKPRLGEANSNAKLTDGAVADIRQCAASGQSLRSLAREYGVCKSTVRRVIQRETWLHIRRKET